MKTRKNFYLTNGSFIAIFMVMVMACLPIMGLPMIAKAEQQQSNPCEGEGCLPGDEKTFLKNDWKDARLDYFETGESDEIVLNLQPKKSIPLTDAPVFKNISTILNKPENRQLRVVLIGTVSDLEIRGGCYVTPDNMYFKLTSHAKGDSAPPSNARNYKSNDECQSALSLSRAHRYRHELINNGVDEKRIIILNFPTLAMSASGNYPNQAVFVWKIGLNESVDPDSLSYEDKPLSFYLRMDIPDDCYLRTNTVFNGEYYEVNVKVIRKADSGRTQSTATPTNNGVESFCKENPWFCGVVGTGIVVGVGYGLLCIKAGDATKDGKTAEGGQIGGCWFQ